MHCVTAKQELAQWGWELAIERVKTGRSCGRDEAVAIEGTEEEIRRKIKEIKSNNKFREELITYFLFIRYGRQGKRKKWGDTQTAK
jgi:hypothetical protein